MERYKRRQSLHHPTGLLLLLYIKEFDSCKFQSCRNPLQIQEILARRDRTLAKRNTLILRHKQLESGHWHEDCFPNGAAMKKILAFALLTMGLILNVGAQTTPILAVPTVSVPDPGSTAVLLGLGFAALAAWHRKNQA